MFERLRHYGIIINLQKCVFGVPSVDFLGHSVDTTGIHPLPARVRTILDFPQPTSLRQLRTFLSLTNFYHRFIPGYARIADSLNTLLAGNKEHLSWNDSQIHAFSALKTVLAHTTLLAHPKPNALTNIMTDASDSAVGAVLQQYVDGQWQSISKKLQPAETRYSAFDRELLAI